MNKCKRAICLALSACLFGALAACTSPEKTTGPVTETPTQEPTETPITPQDEPVTVTDQAGREVTVEADPQTIVSGYYISSSMLLALGEKEQLAGVESKAETRQIYALCGLDVEKVGGYGTKKAFETEKAALLSPDLIVLPYSLRTEADEISLICDAPVLVVNPEDDALMRQDLRMLGAVTRNAERAEQLIDYIDGALKEVTDGITAEQLPTVYLAGVSGLLTTAGAKMYQNTLLVNAKCENVAASLEDTSWANVDYEQLLVWNPDYIVIAAESALTEGEVLSDPNLADLNAVKEGNVFKMPVSYEAWDSPVPSAFLGSLWTVSAVYPEQYSQAEFEETVTEFYEIFYGVEA